MPAIIDLTWANGEAYGPRGVRYQLIPENGLYAVRADEKLIIQNAPMSEAMLAAQRHAVNLADAIGDQTEAINGASSRPSHSPVTIL